ncbi:nonribosomal peptide syntethase 9 [Aspergillus udagawae]|uniref:Nonribosomal peptide syntethase 9 n=1 Tax=Aspergillus udagawae TaxID=91492 RepID=A0ABQ1B0F4_9EURO|nr:nonribosomal peptide syntethase 9 [Aspergillus udagawae]GFF91454.1 nonribosomal peptide syntethase 9 [Aspergillus udagawae]
MSPSPSPSYAPFLSAQLPAFLVKLTASRHGMPRSTSPGRSDGSLLSGQWLQKARRAMEMHGWKHFTSIYHNTRQERCSAGTHLMEITFNFAGRFQQVEQDGAVFRMEPMAKQNLFDGAGKLGRWAMLEINSVILNGMLEFHVTYSRGTDEARVLTPWMDTLVKCLEDLAKGYASMVGSESFILE